MTKKLLQRAKKEGTPLIDGDQVTFVWAGKKGAKPPRLVGDFTDWGWGDEKAELTKTAPGVWTHTATITPDAYIEYAYLTDEGSTPDPYNPRTITNGMGGYNHYFDMPAAAHSDLVKRKRGIAKGKVTQHRIDGGFTLASSPRPVWLYQPPVDEACPLLVVLDGNDYLYRARLAEIVDNLIAQKRIRPIAMAMLKNGGKARFVEYMCSDATLGFIARFVMPYAAGQMKLLDIEAHPGAYGILGASMGGLMALYAGVRLPQLFGKVISQSGAFGFDTNGSETVIYDLIRSREKAPIQVWMDVGRYEWLRTANRKMRGVLEEQRYNLTYREYSGGHNYTIWRDEVVIGLEQVFGG